MSIALSGFDLERGSYRVGIARSAAELDAVYALRAQQFRGGLKPDRDAFDAVCRHVCITDQASGALLGTFRVYESTGAGIGQSYSAQSYDLRKLHGFTGKMMELGRFCIAPHVRDTDVLRIAWASLTRYVDLAGIGFLYGCVSYAGADVAPHAASFSMLHARFRAPDEWAPVRMVSDVCVFADLAQNDLEMRASLQATPSLLRSYLALGAWVSDHAVIDPDLDTIHVFAGLECAKIPERRQALLRAMVE